jgi:hypothetical protein
VLEESLLLARASPKKRQPAPNDTMNQGRKVPQTRAAGDGDRAIQPIWGRGCFYLHVR